MNNSINIHTTCFAFFSVFLITQIGLNADDGILSTKPSFNTIVMDSMSERGLVDSAQFSYEMTHYIKDGDDFEWKQSGYYGFSESESKSVHEFATVYAKGGENPKPYGDSSNEQLAVDTKDGLEYRGGGVSSESLTVVFSPRSMFGRPANLEKPSHSPIIKPFDFRAFGFAFYGDLLSSTPFDKVLANYLLLEDNQIPEVDIGKLPTELKPAQSNCRYFQYGPTYLCVDCDKDFWVTRQLKKGPAYTVLPSGKKKLVQEIRSKCTLYLDQFDGFWLPVRALYQAGSRRLDYKIKWIAVNPEEGKIDFSAATVAKNINKSLIGVKLESSTKENQ